MKRLFAINAILFVALAAHCAPLATENFVTNKIAAAISQIPPPDFSTNNVALVATIEATAPAPGNYAAVSNAAVHAAITNALQDAAISTLSDSISTLNDTKASKSDLDPLLFAQCYPEGNVKSAAEFTQGIKYGSFDTTNRTVSVLPFCNTGDSENDNSDLKGRVVIPPFVDGDGNPYITDDGTRYKVVGVSGSIPTDGNFNLTAIVAPNTVTTIVDSAFNSCDLLTTVSLPAATTIGNRAFDYCYSLSSVSLPAATTIGNRAFDYCSALTSVSLPAATTIGNEAFSFCSALTSVSLPAATTIGDGAFFNCSALTTVSLPAATTIVDSAFNSCDSLTSVSLPAATTIGNRAFDYCYSLSSVSLPAATTIGDGAFDNCPALTTVSLPAATTIGDGAFYYCPSLASVDFGDTPRSSVPSLGDGAFYYVPTNCKIIVPYTQYDEWVAADGWKDLEQEFVRHAEKADKPATFITGNLAEFNSQGNPVDSGKKPSDFANTTNVYTKAETEAKIAGKQDKLPYPTNSIPYAAISGKPSLATVATSGSYNDLSNKPTIPTVPTAQINAATTTNALQDTAIGDLSNDNAQTRQIVTTWENFLDGSNVVFSITNYLSGSYNLDAAKLRILELREGEYHEVFNSRDEILLHIENFRTNDFRAATNQLVGAVNEAIGGKADRDWGKYTSAGGDAPANTVYMTAPNTVFAGGLEYERVAVGEGTICVLTTRGAPTWTQGDEGTFKFQDDGGTNYFGYAKTDSYTIGANTDGITVQGGMVTMNYNITMSGRPCVWYKSSLSTGAWEQLNLPDGSPVAGASHAVTWEANPDPGTQVCYISVGNAPSGFFRATVEVTGEAKFMTNMPADMSGGIVCPNTATGVSGVIKPTFDGTSVIWTWSAK